MENTKIELEDSTLDDTFEKKFKTYRYPHKTYSPHNFL